MTTPKFVRWAVLIGIVIALNLVFVVGRSLVLSEPDFTDYCPDRVAPVQTEDSCIAEGGIWVSYVGDETIPAKVDGYCDFYQTCQPLYDEARDNYELYAFVVLVGLGILSLIVGVLPLGSSIVSSGLSYGGVLALIIAAGGYWNSAGDWLRLLVSVIALGALIYLGLKRFKD